MKHKPRFSKEEVENNKFLIYGHTHVVDVYEENDKIFICPGSTSLSRDITDGSYIILEITEEKIEAVVYKTKTKSILTRYKIR